MLLNKKEIETKLKTLNSDWQVSEQFLTKDFSFSNFYEALLFTNKIGVIAEDQNHHPEIILSWGKVTVKLTTHEENGLTEKDFHLANSIENIKESK